MDATPAWLTRIAFGLSLAVVLTRATMLEVLRDPLDVAAGSQPAPRGPGPAAGLVLDLLAWAPALLVLARGAIDTTFRPPPSWAHGLMLLLAAWTVLSTAWADDKFAALVSGFHFLSAAVFVWAMSQLVRSWRRLRLVAGVCFALLLVYGAQAINYRYVEQPALAEMWKRDGDKLLRERGLEPGSFSARQFEGKILRAEMIGFGASANTFAAVTVLLMVVTMGALAQRLADRDGVGWPIALGAGLALGIMLIRWTDSRTAYATPLLAAGMLGALALARGWLARHARLAYFAGVALVVLIASAVVGHGLYHGTLFHESLTFRWRYWVGAARLVADHPLLGVGWDNFGQHYLAARLPIASEEVRDPHNFIVRFIAELGVIGGVFLLAWMLRLWWELTRPATETIDPGPPRRAVPLLATVVAAALALSILAGVDLGFMSAAGEAGPAFVFLRLIERCAAAILVLVGMTVIAVRSLAGATLDDRPAPWMLHGLLAGLGVFLLHNLVDFSMFEIGPMFLFALLAGSALGIREAQPQGAQTGWQKRPFAALGLLSVVWLAAAVGLAAPVLLAEERADAGDEHLRAGSPAEAAQSYHTASEIAPYNADYLFRQANALRAAGAAPQAWREALEAAIRANPSHAGYWSTLARHEAAQPRPDAARVREAFERALALDPANVPMRRDYAAQLERLGYPAEARLQYEQALAHDDALDPADAERLPPQDLEAIRQAIDRLGA